MPRLTKRVRTLTKLLVSALLTTLVGCAEYGYRVNEIYGFNCRPTALQNEHCVATKGASK
jgi:hypothetical protein